jgi:predicted Zn-dependent protease
MTRDGTFVVRDGAIVAAAKSMRFTQSYLEALAATAAVGDRCKTLWADGMTVNVPAIKLERFNFTSSTQ